MYSPAQSSKVSSNPIAIRNYEPHDIQNIFNVETQRNSYQPYLPLSHVPGRGCDYHNKLKRYNDCACNHSPIRDPIPHYNMTEHDVLSFNSNDVYRNKEKSIKEKMTLINYNQRDNVLLNNPQTQNPEINIFNQSPNSTYDIPILRQKFNLDFINQDPTVTRSRCGVNGIYAAGRKDTGYQYAHPVNINNSTNINNVNVPSATMPVGVVPLKSTLSSSRFKIGHVEVPKKESFRERFSSPILKQADDMYLRALITRAKAVADYLYDSPEFSAYKQNWKLLKQNLDRNGYLFKRLSDTDGDVAYVINKGDDVKFRIRDQAKYVPLNVYQYVLYHEMAHMSTEELQHTETFYKLLNLISLAGFLLGFIDVRRLTEEFYLSDGQPIICKPALKDEIILGCEHLINSGGDQLYYQSIMKAVEGV